MANDIDNSNNKVFALLDTRSLRLPYENEEERKRAEELNKEIAHLGVQTYRSGTDWGYARYEDKLINRTYSQRQRRERRPEPQPFKSGDLVRVFKTVTDGDVHWQGTVSLDRKEYHHGLQRGMDEGDWAEMFYDRLPAKVTTKDGRTLFGMLEPFCETGTEGVIWSVSEYGKTSYDALHCLEDGDKVTVYANVRDGAVEWEGRINFGPQQITKIDWTEVVRTTSPVETRQWLQWSWQHRPAVIVPAP